MMPTSSQTAQIDKRDADSKLRSLVGYNLKRAYHEIQNELTQNLKQIDLKIGSFAVLMAIVEYPGLKQSALAETLAIEQANLVQLIDDLEEKGLIKRERASTDRRAYALFATAEGQQRCQQADAICRSLESDFLIDFSAQDIATLIGFIQKIEQRIQTKRGDDHD